MEMKHITALNCVVQPRRWGGSVLGEKGEKNARVRGMNHILTGACFNLKIKS